VDPVTVSANVAGITNTRSLAHPLFQAAFIGAPRFGVRIFEPATTRALSGLMILSDLLNPRSASHPNTLMTNPSAKVRALLSQQVHGGIYSLPYKLRSASPRSSVWHSAPLCSGPRPSRQRCSARMFDRPSSDTSCASCASRTFRPRR
jgi:hypothetical protein